MIQADCHMHSNFSSDSKAFMEDMIEGSIRHGMKEICFTDHMDYDYPVRGGYDFVFNIEEYIAKLNEMKSRYRNRITILTGVEVGLQPHLKDRIAALTKNNSFDFIIGSSHVVDRLDPYYPEYWTDKTVEEGIRRYYETIVKNCRVISDFHVYGHIDYIIRYIPKQLAANFHYSYRNYLDLLEEALKIIISNGKGIEVNSSGYKYGLGRPHPDADVLKLYRELGGELITIGSDAHAPEHLCYDFETVSELLQSLGYRYYAVFHQGKPVFQKL